MDPAAFVLDVPPAHRERYDGFDAYRPSGQGNDDRPAIVFVHGAPLPPNLPQAPRDSPVFVGYGSLAAQRGAVGIVAEHNIYTAADCIPQADAIIASVAAARALPGVDANRVALWFFSGGGILASDWLVDPPAWLRSVALTYPVLVPPDDWGIPERFRPARDVVSAGALPILVTRVGLETPEFASGIDSFLAEGARRDVKIDVVDLPDGHHGFDMQDYTDASRDAVNEAMAWVMSTLQLAPST